MELITKNKTINLVFTTRKLVTVTNLLKGRNFEELYFKAVNENDLDALSKIIYVFAENSEDGTRSFKANSEEVYEFIDDYKEENNKTYEDIFKEVAGAINDEGFFKTKMTKEQLEDKISNPISSMNMDEIVRNSTQKAMDKITETEVFQGYLG